MGLTLPKGTYPLKDLPTNSSPNIYKAQPRDNAQNADLAGRQRALAL